MCTFLARVIIFDTCFAGAVAKYSVPSVPITHCQFPSSTSTNQSASVSTATVKHLHRPILPPPPRRTPLTVAQSLYSASALRCNRDVVRVLLCLSILQLCALAMAVSPLVSAPNVMT